MGKQTPDWGRSRLGRGACESIREQWLLSDALADEARFLGLTGVLAVVIVDTGLYC